LSFEKNWFDYFSFLVFKTFYMQRPSDENHFGDSPITSTLRMLYFKGRSVSTCYGHPYTFGDVVRDMLTSPSPGDRTFFRQVNEIAGHLGDEFEASAQPMRTVGNQVVYLSVEDVSSRDIQALCDKLAAVADQLSLLETACSFPDI
jgi:hypothetical protein